LSANLFCSVPPWRDERMSTDERIAEALSELRGRSDPASLAGMARYGIATDKALGGTSVPQLRAMAKRLGKDHELATALWGTDIHEARLLATMVDDPAAVSEEQMEAWAADFCSWDLCDQCCSNLLSYAAPSWKKAAEWSRREETYVKRASFALMAALAVHDKKAADRRFLDLLPLIEGAASDERNHVRKAVNWALRQIGKRNPALNSAAIACGERIQAAGGRTARWIAADALRELRSEAVQQRLRDREDKKRREIGP
jgi:3-methyladenine DNA glycosylase AlkD